MHTCMQQSMSDIRSERWCRLTTKFLLHACTLNELDIVIGMMCIYGVYSSNDRTSVS